MAAACYLLVGMLAGRWLLGRFLPDLLEAPANMPRWLVSLPASVLVGITAMTWTAYLGALACRALAAGITLAFLLFVPMAAAGARALLRTPPGPRGLPADRWFPVLCLLIAGGLAWHQARMVGPQTLQVGWSVWLDFGARLSVARSFHLGENFPTEYPHFAGAGMKVHFLFDFLSALLERLGLSLAEAVNVPSVLGLAALWVLLYALGTAVTGSRSAGVLGCVFFCFHSSAGLLTRWLELPEPSLGALVASLLEGSGYLGRTPYESWGIFSFNVFANQRHFPWALAVLALAVLQVWPLLKAGGPAWRPRSWGRPVLLGLLVGGMAYWEGTAAISTCLVLAALLPTCRHRGEVALALGLAALVGLLQAAAFMGPGGTSFQPRWRPGFLAASGNPLGVARYYLEVLGLLPLGVAAAALGAGLRARRLLAAATAPFLVANLVSLTPTPLLGYKLIHASRMLWDLFAAGWLVRLARRGRGGTVLASMLVVLLTASGVADFITLEANTLKPVPIQLDDPLLLWVRDHTRRDDVFLIEPRPHHPVLLAGRRAFLGSPHFAGNAGYDVAGRGALVSALYSGALPPPQMREAARAAGIDYLVVDEWTRRSRYHKLQEEPLRRAFPEVFRDPLGDRRVYRVP